MIKYTQRIYKIKYEKFVELFDDRFKKIESVHSNLKYQSKLNLKLNLRGEINIEFPIIISIKKQGLITEINLLVKPLKVILISFFTALFVSVIFILTQKNVYSIIFGSIVWLIVYLMLKFQIELQLEKYFKNLRANC